MGVEDRNGEGGGGVGIRHDMRSGRDAAVGTENWVEETQAVIAVTPVRIKDRRA